MQAELLISAIVTGVGCLMLLASLWYLAKKKADYRACVVATGTVTSMKSQSSVFVDTDIDGDLYAREQTNMYKSDSLAPVIEFTTAGGKTVAFTAASTKPPRYRPGDRVEVLYPASNPESAVINSFLDKWMLAIFLVCFSGIVVITGGLLLVLL